MKEISDMTQPELEWFRYLQMISKASWEILIDKLWEEKMPGTGISFLEAARNGEVVWYESSRSDGNRRLDV